MSAQSGTGQTGDVPCLADDCSRTFETDKGMRIHFSHAHELDEATLIEEVHRVASITGSVPTVEQLNELGTFTHGPYYNTFGSWSNALEAAGFGPQPSRETSPQVASETLLERLRQFADELGSVPTVQQMNEQGPHSHTVYVDRFGNWNEALRRAGIVEREKHENSVASTRDFGPDWESQRDLAVSRDDDSCRSCGISDDEFDGPLHVHHITPRRVYRTDETLSWENVNELSNLITLCPRCHGRFEGRFMDASPDEFVERTWFDS